MIVILYLIDENKIYMNDNKTSFSELVSQRKEWTARVFIRHFIGITGRQYNTYNNREADDYIVTYLMSE